MASKIINDQWYNECEQDETLESERILNLAAKILDKSINDMKYNTENYPTAENSFLNILINDSLKATAISHSIVQACIPRSCISPLLLGIGVSLDYYLASKWPITTLSKLGVSLSSDEVIKFKRSTSLQSLDSNILKDPDFITQWSADNVDHNISTLDGTGSFHGMGIMSISVEEIVETEETLFY